MGSIPAARTELSRGSCPRTHLTALSCSQRPRVEPGAQPGVGRRLLGPRHPDVRRGIAVAPRRRAHRPLTPAGLQRSRQPDRHGPPRRAGAILASCRGQSRSADGKRAAAEPPRRRRGQRWPPPRSRLLRRCTRRRQRPRQSRARWSPPPRPATAAASRTRPTEWAAHPYPTAFRQETRRLQAPSRLQGPSRLHVPSRLAAAFLPATPPALLEPVHHRRPRGPPRRRLRATATRAHLAVAGQPLPAGQSE